MQRALALGSLAGPLQRKRDLRWDERLAITQSSLATQARSFVCIPLCYVLPKGGGMHNLNQHTCAAGELKPRRFADNHSTGA